MQQLETNKQIVEEQKYKRMGKGRVIAQSRKVYGLVNIDVFYVESESSNDSYYVVKFKPDVFLESWYCSCKDNSIREMKCKHIFAIEFAIQWGTIKGIDGGLPTEAKVRKKVATVSPTTVTVPTTKSSYKDDDYSF